MFKDYNLPFTKIKVQFLFKRFCDDGFLATYE